MKRVLIAGVGALGSHVLLFVRNVPAAFTVVDDDRVEQKNVLSQFHTRMGLGRNKAQALQMAMSGLFGLRVTAIPHRLIAENAAELLGGQDLVVDCLDNHASRSLLQATARRLEIPCVHGALAADGSLGRVVWDPMFQPDSESSAGAATCEDGEHLPLIAFTASALAMAIQRFVSSERRVGFQVWPDGAMRIS